MNDDLTSHLGSEPSTSTVFSSMGIDPIPLDEPPIRRVRLTLPVLGTIEGTIQDIPEELGPSLNDAMDQGRKWAQGIKGCVSYSIYHEAAYYLASGMDPEHIPANAPDPLFNVSNLIAACSYSRLKDPDMFQGFCRGVIDELHTQARSLLKDLKVTQSFPGPEEFERQHGYKRGRPEILVPAWLAGPRAGYGRSDTNPDKAQYLEAVLHLDLSKSMSEQQDVIKVIGKLLLGEMPDALWERAWAGKSPSDHPDDVVRTSGGPSTRWEVWKWQGIVAAVDSPLPVRAGPARTRVVNGIEVVFENTHSAPTPEQVADARAKLAEYEAAVLEYVRITYVYFPLFHWARGMDQTQKDLIAVAEQQTKSDQVIQSEIATGDRSGPQLTEWEVRLAERRKVGLPDLIGGLTRDKLTPEQIEVGERQGWLIVDDVFQPSQSGEVVITNDVITEADFLPPPPTI